MHKLLIGVGIAAFTTTIASAASEASPAAPAPVNVVPAPRTPAAPQQVRVRIMSNKMMTRSEVDQHIRQMFAAFDTNHDGFITHEEIDSRARGMEAMHGNMEQGSADRGMGNRAAMFERLDTNHDGSISRQEFMNGRRIHDERVFVMNGNGSHGPGQMPSGMHGMHMMGMGMRGFGAHLFNMADRDHDGRVSLQEAETAALAHFDRADLNHDGKLSPEERQQAHELMRTHRPS